MDGLRPGTPLADARAAIPGLLTDPAEPERDAKALSALSHWLGRYGPARNVDGRDGLWVDTTGVAHLFGDEGRMLADLSSRLTKAGLSARIGLADTSGASYALARFATRRSSPISSAAPGAQSEALTSLPVAALRLLPDAVLLLQRLGLYRIGQLYGLPRDALAQRFRSSTSRRTGSRNGRSKREREAVLMAGSVLSRLDQALGHMPEPRLPLAEPPSRIARQLFAEPLISATGVATAVEALAIDLCRQMEAQGQGGTRFTLDLYRADGSSHQVVIGASRACREPRHLIALLAEKIDTLDAGFGVDAMTLAATQTESLLETQIALSGAETSAGETLTAALIDRLSNRLGAGCVLRLVRNDSHIPERAQRCVPMLAASIGPHKSIPPSSTLHGARPAFLLPNPEPITVLAEVPEGPPLRFSWRRLTHRIVRAEGPERIEPEWWRAIGRHAGHPGPPLATHFARPRDYYAIEDERGCRYWVFRAGLYRATEEYSGEVEEEHYEAGAAAEARPQWFMHGMLG